MKHVHVITNERAEHQKSWGGAFAEGLRRHGWKVTASHGYDPCDLLVLWGVRRKDVINRQRMSGGEVCILERGYLGDRFANTSVSFGGRLNGHAEFRGPFHDGSRFARHFAHLVQEWKSAGGPGYALLVGQVPGDASLAGVDINAWYARTAAELAAAGYEVCFRPHPVAVERGYRRIVQGAPTLQCDLSQALAGAALVVTYNSNTGVDSVFAGVPTIACNPGSMAWPVAGHAVGEIVTPDRSAWASRLAWCQYTREEMASGYCWEMIGGERCEQAA